MNRWRKEIFFGCLLVALLPLVIQSPGRSVRKPLATEAASHLSRTATSTITSGPNQFGEEMITTTNRRFNLVEFFPGYDLHGRSLLLLEEFRSEGWPGEIVNATVTVDAWTGSFPNPQNKAWTIRAEGNVGETQGNFYKITRYGCCDSQTTHMWFSLIDGQKVFTSTINPIKVDAPNSDADLTRYIAWHSSEAIIPPEEQTTVKDLSGVLQYGSERKVLQRLFLRSAGSLSKVAIRYQGKLHDDRQALEQGLMLIGANNKTGKAALSDFAIVLTFNNQSEVEIPVENDALQIAKARVPTTLILEAAK